MKQIPDPIDFGDFKEARRMANAMVNSLLDALPNTKHTDLDQVDVAAAMAAVTLFLSTGADKEFALHLISEIFDAMKSGKHEAH